ncbi:MAG: DUF3634 family protein [Polyangiaceae bacterium]
MSLLIPALLLVLCIPLVLAVLRANELFFLHVRDGRLRLRRGRMPRPLFDDIADILARGGITDVDVRGVAEDNHPRLYVFGKQPPATVKQQLRNAISLWPVTKIRNAPKQRWQS